MKKLIEKDEFPVKKIEETIAFERHNKHKNGTLIHMYWARRPWVLSRLAIFGSLAKEEMEGLAEIEVKNTVWMKARRYTTGKRVLDPFSGGAVIPFEAAKLGCEVYGVDYNPLAVLIFKALLQYPSRRVMGEISSAVNRITSKMKAEFSDIYGNNDNGFIWAYHYECPECGGKIPLIKSRLLDAKKGLYYHYETDERGYAVLKEGRCTQKDGWFDGKIAICPLCGHIVKRDEIRENFTERSEEVLVGVAVTNGTYRSPTKEDRRIYESVNRPKLSLGEADGFRFHTYKYGYRDYADFFNNRQLYVADRMAEIIKGEKVSKEARLYLTFLFGRFLDYNTRLSYISYHQNKFFHMFSSPRLSPTFNYYEIVPYNRFGYYAGFLLSALANAIKVRPRKAEIVYGSATELPFEDGFFDAVVTDPPYYDYYDYNEMSDFFYLWYRRIIGEDYPELFKGEKTPKEKELVMNPNRNDYEFYRDMMVKAFKEMARVTKDDGVITIIYMHSDVKGWQPILDGAREAGLIMTAYKAINSEQKARLTSARSDKTILMVFRKFDGELKRFSKEELEQIKADIYNLPFGERAAASVFHLCGTVHNLEEVL